MRKVQSFIAALAICGMFATAASAQQFITNQAQFMSLVQPGYYEEGFAGWTFGNPLNGSQTTWAAPGNANFSFTAAATNGLWSNPGALSTNNAGDPIDFTFANSPNTVTAFGGNLFGSDINGNFIPSLVSVTTNAGVFSHQVNDPNATFLGFVFANGAITSFSVDTTQPGVNSWPAADNLITGQAIPEPGTFVALGLLSMVGLATYRRRK